MIRALRDLADALSTACRAFRANYSDRRLWLRDLRETARKWKACSERGHLWRVDGSVMPHMHSERGVMTRVYRCPSCGMFEWGSEPPAADYYRDPERLSAHEVVL